MTSSLLAIASGGALGAVLRHSLNSWLTQMTAEGFPWGIFACNILGSFAMGLLISAFAHIWDVHQNTKLFLTTGMLGAFTTFSTFSLDTVKLIETGHFLTAALYVSGSIVLSVLGLALGLYTIRMIFS